MSSKLIEGCVDKTSEILGIPQKDVAKVLLGYIKPCFWKVKFSLKGCAKLTTRKSSYKGGHPKVLQPYIAKDLDEVQEYIVSQISPTQEEFKGMCKEKYLETTESWTRLCAGDLTFDEYVGVLRKYISAKLKGESSQKSSLNTDFEKSSDGKWGLTPRNKKDKLSLDESGKITFKYFRYTIKVKRFELGGDISKKLNTSKFYGIRPKLVLSYYEDVVGLFGSEGALMSYVRALFPKNHVIQKVTDFDIFEKVLDSEFNNKDEAGKLSISNFQDVEEAPYFSEASMEFILNNPTIPSSTDFVIFSKEFEKRMKRVKK